MTEIGKNKTRNNILKVGSKNLNAENWAVYHPDGTHMFTCGEKKARWYLERKLAKKTCDGKIQLTFTPKGNGFESNEIFGKSVRESICVVTGVPDGLQRHHIVPYCYRTYFPEKYKSKNHHDVVLINHEKHSEYETQATHYKDRIGEMYGVKTITEFNREYTTKLREAGRKNVIILNNIHSIFKTYGKISRDIKLKKLKMISDDTGIPFETVCNYSYVQLYKMYLLLKEEHEREIFVFKGNNRILYDHGYHVVQKLDTEEKIEDFVKLWRKHFIETLNPQYMPKGWSIDFRIKTNI
jgi:exonuclease 3'-5' domain-containing protein 2